MADICLALGGGGIKGVAHLGAIRKLEEEGFTIKAISGTSAGSIVGALYACGYSVDEIMEIFNSIDQSQMFGHEQNDRVSILGIRGLKTLLSTLLGSSTFQDTKIPFACTAVDINTSKEIVIKEGPLLQAMVASSAVPGVFPPVQAGEFLLVDGGVLDPVPVTLARYLAPELPVFAVSLSAIPREHDRMAPFQMPKNSPIPSTIVDQVSKLRISQAIKIFLQSMEITSRMIAQLQEELDPPDVMIRPDVEEFFMLDKVPFDVLFERGYLAASKMVHEMQESISWSNNLKRHFRQSRSPEWVEYHSDGLYHGK